MSEKKQEVTSKSSGKKKANKKNISVGNAYIQATFNNTIITFTDQQGNVVSWSSSGMSGFKGSRKGTPFAAQVAAEDAGKKAWDHGLDRNYGVHYLEGRMKHWTWDRNELIDIRKTDFGRYIKKLSNDISCNTNRGKAGSV